VIAEGERFASHSLSLDLARDGKTVAASSREWTAAWDVAGRQLLRRWPAVGDEAPQVRVCPDGRQLVTLRKSDGLIAFLDLATGRETRRPGNLTGASVLGFSSDGRLLAVAGQAPVIRVFDVNRRRELFSLEFGQGQATAGAFSPDGRRLAAGESGGAIRLWDLRTRREVGLLTGHHSMIYSLAFLDADTLASTTREEARLWRASDSESAPIAVEPARGP
jgi:WD40 repeat protein